MKVVQHPGHAAARAGDPGQRAEGGFDLEIQPVEYTTLLDAQTRGDFELLQLGWSGRIDPHGNMYSFLATGQANNYSGYSNPQVDGC